MSRDKIFCGSGYATQHDWLTNLHVWIDDVPPEHIRATSDGRRFVRLSLCRKRDPAADPAFYITVDTYDSGANDQQEQQQQQAPRTITNEQTNNDSIDDIPF